MTLKGRGLVTRFLNLPKRQLPLWNGPTGMPSSEDSFTSVRVFVCLCLFCSLKSGSIPGVFQEHCWVSGFVVSLKMMRDLGDAGVHHTRACTHLTHDVPTWLGSQCPTQPPLQEISSVLGFCHFQPRTGFLGRLVGAGGSLRALQSWLHVLGPTVEPCPAHLVVLAMHDKMQHDEVMAVAGRLHMEQEAVDEVLHESPDEHAQQEEAYEYRLWHHH